LDAHSNVYANLYTDEGAYSYTDPHTIVDTNSNDHAYSYANGDTNAHIDTNPNTYIHTDGHANSGTYQCGSLRGSGTSPDPRFRESRYTYRNGPR
jgi:hypothetical protein